jgi:hypothetical protein
MTDAITTTFAEWLEAAGVAADDSSDATGAALLARLRVMYPESFAQHDPLNALASHVAGRFAVMTATSLFVPPAGPKVALPPALCAAVRAHDRPQRNPLTVEVACPVCQERRPVSFQSLKHNGAAGRRCLKCARNNREAA